MKKLLIALGCISTLTTLTACNAGKSNTTTENKIIPNYTLYFEPESMVNLTVGESRNIVLNLTSNSTEISGEIGVLFINSNESAIAYYPEHGCWFNYPSITKCYVGVLKLTETESPVIITPIVPVDYNFTSVQSLTVN